MQNQLILLKQEDGRILSALSDGTRIISFRVSDGLAADGRICRIGNIYLGRVQNIVQNIGAAFIELETGTTGFLSLTEKQPPLFANSKKTDKLCIGDLVVVQVAKEPIKSKPASLTGQLTLTGKYCVLTGNDHRIQISQKIDSAEEREQLKTLMNGFIEEARTEYPDRVPGFILRTNAGQAAADKIKREALVLLSKYQEIVTYGVHKNQFTLLHETVPSYLADIRDGRSETLTRIITDDPDLYGQVLRYLEEYQPEDLFKLVLYRDEAYSLRSLHSIDTSLKKALQERVWLNSGAYLIIEHTEALTVIDVNSGKAIAGRQKAQEVFYKINREAAQEIAFQLKLRDISGMILIDFIDMKDKASDQELLSYMAALVKQDTTKTTVVDMTALGLMELTRKRLSRPLRESFYTNTLGGVQL